jgi:hypothetical protein
MVYWYDFVYSPPGFYGKDIAIDALSAIVVLLISYFSFRYFLLDRKNNKQALASIAFLLLGLSFIAKILINVITHNEKLLTSHMIIFGVDFGITYSVFSAVGFLAHAFLTLFGFYLLYALASKDSLSMNYIIIAYLLVISTYFSRFNYSIFYLTTLLFVAALSRRYFMSFKEFKYRNTLLLCYSFSIIGISQFIFIFTVHSRMLYVAAEILQVIGYLFLLYTFLMVLKNARQKDKD